MTTTVGYIFKGLPFPAYPLGYTVPPRGSVVVGCRGLNLFAIDLDGFEWVQLADYPVWVPTGAWLRNGKSGNGYYPSVERERNHRMRERV